VPSSADINRHIPGAEPGDGLGKAPMNKQVNRLTAKRIAKLGDGRHHDGHGLVLNIKGTAKSWLLRYQRDGRERWLGLGPLHVFGLSEARLRAKQARQKIYDGEDPIDAKKQRRAQRRLEAASAVTFGQCANAYVDAHRAEWTRRHHEQWLNSLRDWVLPKIGDLPVAAIDTAAVLSVLRPIWTTKTVTAVRIRSRIECVLDYARTAGYRTGENPARWKGHIENLLPKPSKVAKVQHLDAMPYKEVPAFLVELREREDISARALEFAILTAARSGEVVSACWSEIDFAGKIWTIPSERMKSGREHRVPLSDAALELINQLPRKSDYLFPSKRARQVRGEFIIHLLRAMGHAKITAHGFRSSFRDWAGERTNFPREIAEAALAHRTGDATELAYRRGDALEKRRQLMEAWARYCSIPPVKETDTVRTFRRSA
jgi:integrase